ncbi:MAG: hypothetical protein K2X99_02540 [Gemmatimonadaceae bacterium]|nr:hypothetical protein [Gemmatimonadaceae bacterium]
MLISSVELRSQAVPVGSPLGFSASVINRGSVTSVEVELVARLCFGDCPQTLARVLVPALASGDTFNVSDRLRVRPGNGGRIEFQLDPEATVADVNRENNRFVVPSTTLALPELVLETFELEPSAKSGAPVPVRLVLANPSRVAVAPATALLVSSDVGAAPGGGPWRTSIPVPELFPGQRIEMRMLVRDGASGIRGTSSDGTRVQWSVRLDRGEVEWKQVPDTWYAFKVIP